MKISPVRGKPQPVLVGAAVVAGTAWAAYLLDASDAATGLATTFALAVTSLVVRERVKV